MALPDYLIIGAQRAGTTSLYEWLAQHPDIVAARQKEVRFFTFHYRKGKDWYGRQLGVRTKTSLHGEAEPNYLFCAYTIERIKQLMPGVKLIALARDPVKRAFSNWKLMRDHGIEKLPFGEALRQEARRVKQSEHNRLHFSYKGRGYYWQQLEPWLAAFGDQLLVIKSETMFAKPEAVYAQVLAFLGARPHRLLAYNPHNRKGQRGLHPATRDYLREHFAPHNQQLAEALGRNDLIW